MITAYTIMQFYTLTSIEPVHFILLCSIILDSLKVEKRIDSFSTSRIVTLIHHSMEWVESIVNGLGLVM